MTGILKGTIRPQAVLKGEISKTVEIIGSVIKPLTVTENGTHEVPEGVNGFNPVIVSIPERKEEQEKSLTITENGSYQVLPDENKVLSSVSLEVDVKDETLAEIETAIDESGVLDSTEGTVEEKVEVLIDKAEDENLWYEMSGNWTALPSGFIKAQVETLPKMDFSKITSLTYGFSTVPLKRIDYYINSDNCSNFNTTFGNCRQLEYVKGINTSKSTNVSVMFRDCNALKTIEEPLDFSSLTSNISAFQYTPVIETVRFIEGSIKYSITFNSPLLSAESIQSIIDGLAYVETTQKITFNTTVVSKLTDEQMTQILLKNWEVG